MKAMELSKFIGSLVGTGIGDSLGAGSEGFFGYREVREIGNRYTDDTHMMIGVAESLIEKRGFNGEHMVKTFIKNYEAEPWRGYGPGPPGVFRLIKQGESWDKAAEKLYSGGSFGNGSAMRIAPLACFYYDNPVSLKRAAYESSKLTHSHILGVEGAALQAYATALAVSIRDSVRSYAFLKKLENFIKADVYKRKIEKIEELLSSRADRKEVTRELGNGIEAFNSVPTAIYSFLANPNFEEAVVYAVSLGGDSDTIGAMTGAVSGAYWGIEAIPERWRDKLENGEFIEKLAKKLWEIKRRKK
ncbi:MAG: ADP-ribosylglycohydrolase family protein [Candidatus Aerophobetes bacterium]|nr:ADP-ribosylglycohydrolase family protein [Candidatus Aerophobetes bacterium]